MQAVILAAGESSRFWPLNQRHKSLLKIMGKPLIWYTIESLKRVGIKDIIIVQGPKRDVEEELKNYQLGIEIKYVIQPEPKGMGDAVLCAQSLISGPFFVLHAHKVNVGDFIKLMAEKLQETKAELVFLGIKTDQPWLYGMLKIEGGKVVGLIEKPEKGKEYRYIREFKIVKEDKSLSSPSPAKAGSVGDEPDGSSSPLPLLRKGSVIDVSIFQKGEKVKISGISKGKGFAGVVKRWGFAGRSTSHGTKHELRTPGSVGASFPERVIKGKKMPGRMGGARVTVKNLEVVKVDPENNLLTVKGAVTGAKGTLLEICSGS